MPLVSPIANRLVRMRLATIIAAGEPGAVLRDAGVISSYLGDSPESIARSGRRRSRPDEMAGTRSGGGWAGM